MNEVKITVKNYRCFSDTQPARFVLKNGLTSFIGVNNAGKSSVLKIFYEFRDLFVKSSTSHFLFVNNGDHPNFPDEIDDPQEVFNNENNRSMKIEFEFTNPTDIIAGKLVGRLVIIISRELIFSVCFFDSTNLEIVLSNSTTSPVNLVENSSQMISTMESLSRIFYVGAFRNAINPFKTQDYMTENTINAQLMSYYDMTIGAKFIKYWKSFKTGTDRENRKRSIGITSDICRIFKFDTLEITQSDTDRNIIFIINGNTYNLSEIGSGIAQFFLVLANIAIKNPSFILIDEPEINLHPSLQIEFLNVLENYASNGVLYATHSIGLARCADRIYSVYRDENKKSTIREFERKSILTELLGELSYSAYRELGFNKVLLVEGRTEIKVVQQFLRKYDKDNEFFVVSLGGSQYICEHSQDELREFMRTSEKIFAMIDSEKDASDKSVETSRQKFVDNCKDIGIECHILEYRATENYFPERVVKLVKGDNCKMLKPFEKLDDRWAKSENWRLAQEMKKEELEATDLGIFIKKICEI